MSRISELLEQIATAVYGREVRSAIHDSIEECYDDVTSGSTLANAAAASANAAANNANTKATLADNAATSANEAASSASGAASSATAAATNANAKAALADTAATSANTAATNANTKANLANDAATNANNKASLADQKATLANNAASTASTAAEAANTAATNANTKATAANTAASSANSAATSATTAATNANSKASLADTAATNANTKASLADQKATLADQKATLADQKATLANNAAVTASSKITDMDAALADCAIATAAAEAAVSTIDSRIATKYTKPTGGIPATDLSSDIRASLFNADNAIQGPTDTTLLYEGMAADSFAVGTKFFEQSDRIAELDIRTAVLKIAQTKQLASFDEFKNLLPLSEYNTLWYDALIGCEIADTWTAEDGTEYSDPMIVVSLENIEDANGETHWGAYVQRKWATKNGIQFDAPEAEEATEPTAQEGLYYYGQTGSTLTKTALTLLELNVGDAIPYGDYDKIYHNDIQDATCYIVSNGYNNWRQSAYRQYLNSSAGVGEWWEYQHEGDVEPSQLSSVRGYMAGCSAALVGVNGVGGAAKKCKVYCNTNTVTDGGVVETTVDTFWLPSVTQMYGVGNSDEGVYWPYWKRATGLPSPDNAANDGRKIYAIEANASAQNCRLRSAYRNYSCTVWLAETSGSFSNNNAHGYYRAAPACAIW